jgi:hypothetical protein
MSALASPHAPPAALESARAAMRGAKQFRNTRKAAWLGHIVRVFPESARAAGRGARHWKNHPFSRVRRLNLREFLRRRPL